jgi:hypothetical protein
MNKSAVCALLLMSGSLASRPSIAQIPPGCESNYTSLQFADVTGDGKADAIVVNSDGITVRRSSGSAFLPNETWTTNAYYGSLGSVPVYFADVTGDGLADAIVVNPNGVTVRRSNGSLFEGNEFWTAQIGNPNEGIFFADVDGDGRADEIVVNSTSGVWVGLSTGTAFEALRQWTTNPYYGTYHIGVYGDSAANPQVLDYIAFADVTGNKRADAIVINSNGITVRRSSGSAVNGFLPNELWTTDPGAPGCVVSFADVNGDGRADAIYNCSTGTYVRLSNGNFFTSPVNWTSNPYYGNIATYYADVTGDHKADAIAANYSGIDVRRSNGSIFQPPDTPSWAGPYYGDVRYVCLSN